MTARGLIRRLRHRLATRATDRALRQLEPVAVPRLGFPELGPPAFGICRAGTLCCGAAESSVPCVPSPEYFRDGRP